ncbi:hypothetical protein [Nostoc sp. CMAA1605]|uniref:hypothetical protein n=1 Tax=Nostoc sp. CMAA1605 TaxID=2055159 RepID=UPI001F425EAF|nr:hypothetical protein [Nostoc sp. CMAA1605]MCF4965807.1 hypothetical protein [Nostoc sp. CMAA1605]
MLSLIIPAQIFVLSAALLINGFNWHQSHQKQDTKPQINIANLANGNYQFCSQPDPQDWRVGAGVCANFQKTANRFEGYYGYPHSDNFICIRGNVKGNLITGEAFAILWSGNQQNHLPQSRFIWDAEGRLTLSQSYLMGTANHHEDAMQRIFYRQALLNLEGFYQYNRPRMTPPLQLCKWN